MSPQRAGRGSEWNLAAALVLLLACGGGRESARDGGGDVVGDRKAVDTAEDAAVADAAEDAAVADAAEDAAVVDTAEDAAIDAALMDGAADSGPVIDTGASEPVTDGPADLHASDSGAEASCLPLFDAGVPDAERPDVRGADLGSAASRSLVQVVAGGPWRTVQSAPGLAVDSQGRVYVADSDRIHIVQGNTVSLYLTSAEVHAAVPAVISTSFVDDLDVGPDDQLYILAWDLLLKSSGPHQASLWQRTSLLQSHPHRMNVVGTDHVLFVHRGGLSRATACGIQPVFDMRALNGSTECATEDIAAAPSGIFLYAPGCNGSPVIRGRADGSRVELLFEDDYFAPASPYAANFLCLARDPEGGFYAVVNEYHRGSGLYHIAEDASAQRGVAHIPTVPSLAQLEQAATEPFAFRYCSIATARDGTIFLQTRSQLWKVTR